ncbi:MAG: aldehyde dehydrogenase family protein [Bacteroidota bacterium]
MNTRNPRTGQKDYFVAEIPTTVIADECKQLKAAQYNWSSGGLKNRSAILQEWKTFIEVERAALLEALQLDTGRIWETKLEIDLLFSSIDRWCKLAETFFEESPSKATQIPFIRLQQDWVPYGLVGVISPWNFPLLLSLIDTIPALLAGCAVIVKPSEVTPRFIEVINRTIAKVPELNAVLRYVAGDGKIGAALVDHADLICFTGSTTTGRKVYAAAAQRMIPVFLELGGKDPAVVLPSANLETAAASICWGGTANAGQSCLSIERIYVHESISEQFVELLTKRAADLMLNADNIIHGEIGPIIFEKQVAIINEHLQDAFDKGAQLLTGSRQCELINGGYYCRPTVLTQVNHSMKIMQEETFGPILPVMTFRDTAEAIALANDSVYGLSAAVFAGTTEEAIQIGKHITAGAISINDAALTAIMHEGEKSSFKLSGIGGTRMGAAALKRFLRQKVFIIKEGNDYSPWTIKLQRNQST